MPSLDAHHPEGLPARLDEVLTGPVVEVAVRLLGAMLHSYVDDAHVTLRVTEVEAYDGGNDPGSHAYRGRTPRTEVMFGDPGHLYVYFTYGMHWCANVVTGDPGRASAVLLRAGEVVEGHEVARERRSSSRRDVDLARGPARLAQALGVDGSLNGHHLAAAPLLLVPPTHRADAAQVARGPRVGVSGPGGDGERFPWRFWLSGDPTVSAYRAGKPLRRG